MTTTVTDGLEYCDGCNYWLPDCKCSPIAIAARSLAPPRDRLDAQSERRLEAEQSRNRTLVIENRRLRLEVARLRGTINAKRRRR